MCLPNVSANNQGPRRACQPPDDGALPCRSRAKQVAIETLNEHAISPVLEERRYNFRYSEQNEPDGKGDNSLQTNSRPARIRTWDQRIMSRSTRIPLDTSALLVCASETISKKEQCYPIVRRIPDLILIPVTVASQSILGALPPIRYRAPSSSIICQLSSFGVLKMTACV